MIIIHFVDLEAILSMSIYSEQEYKYIVRSKSGKHGLVHAIYGNTRLTAAISIPISINGIFSIPRSGLEHIT